MPASRYWQMFGFTSGLPVETEETGSDDIV